jgi:Bacterial antitoxin of type II TA system, VapB
MHTQIELDDGLITQLLQLTQLNSVPEAITEALRVLVTLKQQGLLPSSSATFHSTGVIWEEGTKESFIGMWKDREDMKNSVAWVRQLRLQEWR